MQKKNESLKVSWFHIDYPYNMFRGLKEHGINTEKIEYTLKFVSFQTECMWHTVMLIAVVIASLSSRAQCEPSDSNVNVTAVLHTSCQEESDQNLISEDCERRIDLEFSIKNNDRVSFCHNISHFIII